LYLKAERIARVPAKRESLGRSTEINEDNPNSVRSEVFTAVTMKTAVFWDVTPCGSLRTNVSEERIASIIRVKRNSSN
jgi:hypothetical protein